MKDCNFGPDGQAFDYDFKTHDALPHLVRDHGFTSEAVCAYAAEHSKARPLGQVVASTK